MFVRNTLPLNDTKKSYPYWYIVEFFLNFTFEKGITKGIMLWILSLTKVTSLFILTLIERDDGQKKQIVETPTNGSCV